MTEKEVTKTYWFSDDGFEFLSETACQAYEEAKKDAEEGAKIPYTKVQWPVYIDGNKEARLYTLRNKAEFQSLFKFLSWYKNNMQTVYAPTSYPCIYITVNAGQTFPLAFEITKKCFSDFTIFYEALKNKFNQE